MLKDYDFEKHNEEVKQVWESFYAGCPVRVPMTLGLATRFYIMNPEANPKGITFRQYTMDPLVMLECALQFEYWRRHNIPFDMEMGLPQEWSVSVDFQNFYEAAWFGAVIHFPEGQVPTSKILLNDDNKHMLFDKGLPDPLKDGGWMERNIEYWEYFREKIREGYEYQGRPLGSANLGAMGTDGPFTAAVNLRGQAICMDMYLDPEYYHQLMDFITEATILRIKTYRQLTGEEVIRERFDLADDSIELLSVEQYREFVLPYHKKLMQFFSTGKHNGIHLCGDVGRHLPLIKEELQVMEFDTGYPIDLAEMRRGLGPEVLLKGGPHIELLRRGTPKAVHAEVRRVLSSGVTEGGKFIIREANNLAPGTPLENIVTFYDTVKTYGKY